MRVSRMPRAFLVSVVIFAATAHAAHAADKLWDDGEPADSFWSSRNNWDPDEKPQPADKAIVGGNPEVNSVEIFGELENSGAITITDGTLQPQGDTLNNGTIDVGDGSAVLSQLIVGNGRSISGSGEVVLRNSDNLPGSGATLRGGFSTASVNEAGHTIRGEGSIIQRWQNDGVVVAEETSGNSSAVLWLTNTTFLNNGELRSAAGASISFAGAVYSQGASGQLIADTDNITITGATSITGGSLESVGGGVFDSNGLVTLSGVTVNAPIDNTNTSGPINDARLYVDTGGLTNNSIITLAGAAGRNSQFGFTSPGTLDGVGEIVLDGVPGLAFISVFPGGAAEFTQGASHTIRGAGGIGSRIVNNGTIRAEPGTTESILLINNPQTNNGLMQAGTGATLEFQSNVSDTVQGATGVISAADGGRVELENTSVTGGRLETAGTGRIVVTASSTLNNVTNAGALDVPTSIVLRVGGGSLTNDGVITINSDGGFGVPGLLALQDTLLTGSGEVYLDGYNNNSRSDIFPDGFTITQDAGHTVRGKGEIIGAGKFVNDGRVAGDSAADPVRIRTRLEGDGQLENVSIDFNANLSVHAPGNGVGTVQLEGSYAITHPLVRLEIELAGTTPGSGHDQLSSTGSVSLGGILDVRMVDGFVPAAGDRFTIVESAGDPIAGVFNSTRLPQTANFAIAWAPVEYNAGSVVIEATSVTALPGDYNADGVVNAADYTVWRDTEGASGVPVFSGADGNGDGDIDQLDYDVWANNFGATAASLAVSTPEPSATALVLVALSVAEGRRSRD